MDSKDTIASLNKALTICSEANANLSRLLAESHANLDAAITKAKREVLLEAADIADSGVVEGHHGNDVMTRHNIGGELRRMADEV